MAKILFLCGSDPWTQTSGYFIYSARCVELLARTHSVCVGSLFRPIPDMLVAPTIKRICFSEQRPNVRGQRLKSLFGRRSFCEMEFNYPGVASWVEDLTEQESPDLIIYNHIRAAWLAPHLGRVGIPTLYLAHNAEGLAYTSIAKLESNPLGKLFAYQEGRKLEHLEARILHIVDSAITLTEEDRGRLQALRPDLAVDVVPPCFEVVPEVARPSGARSTLLVVGSFHWRPKRTNLLWFLREIYLPLKGGRPDLRCLIVGANAGALRKDVPADAGIELHADVPDVSPYLNLPVIFVTPERQSGGIKLKTCEAAVHGLPIVSTSPGMEGTGLRDKVSCLVANTPAELQSALVRLLDDPDLSEALGHKAREAARGRFSPDAVAHQLNQTIERALLPSGAQRP